MSEDERLRALLGRVESLRCKGLCADSCGPLKARPGEETRIRLHCAQKGIPWHSLAKHRAQAIPLIEKHGYAAGNLYPERIFCPYLQELRCSIHEVRPVLCRLWGAWEKLPCPHGCEMDGGPLTEKEGWKLLASGI